MKKLNKMKFLFIEIEGESDVMGKFAFAQLDAYRHRASFLALKNAQYFHFFLFFLHIIKSIDIDGISCFSTNCWKFYHYAIDEVF